jgi:murein lipoprotein
MKASQIVKPAIVALAIGLFSGCATTSKTTVEDVQNTANQASQEAKAAQDSADKAMSAANSARATADSAKRTADDAASLARQAMDASDRNSAAIKELNEKIDRMFKKAMHK